MERYQAKNQATDLLWDNIEQSLWWFAVGNLSDSDKVQKKIEILATHWHPTFTTFLTSVNGTIQTLIPNDIHEILQYGAGRRSISMYNALKTISSVAYFGREKVLTKDEKRSLDDALLLFYVHLVGFFDAIAIAFHRVFLENFNVPENRADLLSTQFRNHLGLPYLDSIMDKNDEWLTRVKEEYRNRYVHRVLPYVTPAVYTQSESDEFDRLEKEILPAILEGRSGDLEGLREQQEKLGKFHPYLIFTETDGHVPILSSVLNDAMRFQVIALEVFEVLLPKLEFQPIKP